MRLYEIALIAGLALAGVPAGAFAAKPSHPPTPASTNTTASPAGKAGTANVQFVLHGSLSAYTAANGATNGTVSLMVKSSNHDSNTLKGMTLVFIVSWTPRSSCTTVKQSATATTASSSSARRKAPRRGRA